MDLNLDKTKLLKIIWKETEDIDEISNEAKADVSAEWIKQLFTDFYWI